MFTDGRGDTDGRATTAKSFRTTRWTPMADDAIMNKGGAAVLWERKRWGYDSVVAVMVVDGGGG